jgi:hypothetical protein
MWNSLLDLKGTQMKLLTFSAIFILASFLAPAKAYSCTCEIFGDGGPRSMKQHAKAVFIGEVLEVRAATKAEREEYSNAYIVRMHVERYWKGIKSDEVAVETDLTGCGPNLQVGEKYLVYGMGKRLDTSCTGTRKLEYAEKDLKALGRAKELKPR